MTATSARRFRDTFLILLAGLALASPVSAQDANKKVLTLYSTRRDVQFSLVGENALPRILDTGLAGRLDYYSEFIDQTRFPDPAYPAAFRDYLGLKYKGVQFDLVIAMQDAAVRFVNTYRDTLFRDASEVFLTNTPDPVRGPNATGFVHERNFASTIALIRQLQPDVQEVFIVTGAAAADRQYAAAVRKQLPSDSPLKFSDLSGLPTAALETRLKTLPPHSAVYYVLVIQDGAGDRYNPLEYVDRIAAAANAPTYCWVDSVMDHGVLGGSLYSQRKAIEQIGQLALRVLNGEPADRIPVSALEVNAYQVDWRQLRRWKIDESRLPPGTIVDFRTPTVWDRYGSYILAAAGLLMAQSALITGLLIQRRRRRLAEANLRRSQGDLRNSLDRIRDLGGRLLRAQDAERARIASELHDDICQRMLLLTIELESIGRARYEEAPFAAAVTFSKDISKSLHELSHRLHPTRLRLVGLIAALDQLARDVSRAGVVTTFTHDNVPATVPPDVMLCLFRAVQESLQNAIKHSGATTIAVKASSTGDRLTVTVDDNGAGFDVGAAWGKGLGLVSMVERLEAIGGTLEVRSAPGAGTHVTATAPLTA